MTGQQAFPPGFSATVHLNWKVNGEDKWIMLGCLKNEKPSAIYRLKGLTQQSGGAAMPNTAAIGISIESNADVDAQMANKNRTGSSAAADMDGMQTETSDSAGGGGALVKFGQIDEATQTQLALAMAPKIASNIFSYLSSFAPDSAPQTVPLLKRWLEQFERKLRAQGIGFLARAEAE
ncbi:uncharacterized protein FA14DRAFT_162517 [Meira miltonrushii]|uniref:Uncharacterized protein n=1 Tax=Meira miltonrushii TaxID=1280837 RepID=A0A316V4B5_9BASI|nr:uncharacterized protein FA14DRAFT_162517 [Meira miltonrushii]PWN32387.1 hypothetical protein FA14DRAFT_162517 [Meira miltonrushii]